ncbi:MAG TPA: hypothetical protein ENN03_10520 [bacterium]|nr:hypothetical protein [bacterium]
MTIDLSVIPATKRNMSINKESIFMNILKYAVPIVSLLLVHCTTEQKSWEMTKVSDTPSAYEDFLEKYPQSQFADSARFLIEKMHFDQARAANTKQAYNNFLKNHPESLLAKEARYRIKNLWTIKELSYSIITEISGSSAPHTKLFKKAKTGCIIEIRGLYIVPASQNATVKLKDITLSGESFDKDKQMKWELSPIGQGFQGSKGYYAYHFLDHLASGAVKIQSLSGEGFELAKESVEDPGTMKILGGELWLCLAFAVPETPKTPFTLKFGHNTVIIE